MPRKLYYWQVHISAVEWIFKRKIRHNTETKNPCLNAIIDIEFFIFVIFYHKKYESAKSKILDFFFPVDRILKYNFYFYFNPVNKKNNETERQCCFSDNVTVCGKSKN